MGRKGYQETRQKTKLWSKTVLTGITKKEKGNGEVDLSDEKISKMSERALGFERSFAKRHTYLSSTRKNETLQNRQKRVLIRLYNALPQITLLKVTRFS